MGIALTDRYRGPAELSDGLGYGGRFLAARDEKVEATSSRLVRPLDVDLLGGFVVALFYHPYRFDGRVETASEGGLCLCWGVTIDQQRQERRLQSLLPYPQETRRQHWGAPLGLTGSDSRFRLQGKRPSGTLRKRTRIPIGLLVHPNWAPPTQIRTG